MLNVKSLPSVVDLADIQGTYVLMRGPLNVPVVDGVVQNQFRLLRMLPTLQKLTDAGARVILCGHIANVKSNEVHETLRPVYETLMSHFDITFSEEVLGAQTTALRDAMSDGQVLLLENLRRDPREKQNEPTFASELAALADVYVNDAFAASHRAHASIVGIPRLLPSYFGFNFLQECEELNKTTAPKNPSLFILGGAKFATKLPLVTRFLDAYDHVFIGGALANDMFRAQGYEIGTSIVSDIDLSGSPLLQHPKILLPKDVTVQNQKGERRVTLPHDVQPDEAILDAGPSTVAMLELFTRNAATVLWNGPLGNYQNGFAAQTEALARAIGDSSAYTLVGGGDTIAAIESLGCQEKYSFLSTAGGAMLTYLEEGTLPAIAAVVE